MSGPENRAGNRGVQLPTCRRAAVRAASPRPQPQDGAGSSRAHLAVESRGKVAEAGEIWGRRRLEAELLAVLLVSGASIPRRERKMDMGAKE
jgi:hypothetical protein